MTINLRPYQIKTITALKDAFRNGNKKVVMCAPTGSGKTFTFTAMIAEASKRNKKILILTHRSELLTQSGGALKTFNIIPQNINPKLKKLNFDSLVSVAMAQTLKRRILKEEYQIWLKDLDLLIIDESHTQDADIILDQLSEKCFIIGATATPFREHNSRQLSTIYSKIIEEVKISDLIDEGFLAEPKYFGVPTDLKGIGTKGGDYDFAEMGKVFSERQLYHGVYDNYMAKCPGKKTIIFAPSVQASIDLVNDFKNKGLQIKHIDANTPTELRKATLQWFKDTNGAMISNVGILNAGFDEPTIEVVILYRATKSLPLFLQMCGRGSRTTPTKKSFLILDFGENISTHGYWHEERQWYLENKKKKKEGIAPVKECPECTAIIPSSVMICPYCQYEIPPKEKDEEEVFAELVELLSYREIMEMSKNATFKELEIIAEKKGFKQGWILHQLGTEESIRGYAKYKNYHPKWAEIKILNRKK